ncbi:MAG: 6-phosphofructokinase, partial [Clostridiales bacterium]|nr:6-phosphofructokinase [Clostridiales bacterium]
KTTQKRGKRHSIIVLAEGADSAGNLKQKIEDASGLELRVTILGHVQRGGSPTVFDRILASKMGVRAVELLLDGISNRVVGIKDNDIVDLGILDALSKEKKFDRDVYEMAKILSI